MLTRRQLTVKDPVQLRQQRRAELFRGIYHDRTMIILGYIMADADSAEFNFGVGFDPKYDLP